VDATAGAHFSQLIFGEGPSRMPAEAVHPAMLVVQGNPGMPAKRTIAIGRNHGVEGHEPVRGSPIIMSVVSVPSGRNQKTVVGLEDFDFWRRIRSNEFSPPALSSQHTVFRLFGNQNSISMQTRHMA